MTTTYVAVDLETTGLDPYRDAIIEVAAIVFREGEVLEEFSSLVNPQQPLPEFITGLTGITTEMVAGAPSMFSLRSRLRGLLADHVVVGHNVSFDMGFLEQESIGVRQPRIDTVTLASVLVPDAGRFSLDALSQYLALPGGEQEQAHRALADARLVVALFHDLRARSSRLSFSQLDEIVAAGQNLGWPETLFFEEMLRERGRTAFGQRAGRPRRLFDPELANEPPPVPREAPEPMDIQVIVDMLHPEGNFGRQFPDYEYRQEQVDMLVAVAEALNSGEHLIVEAGTGTGKSVGYLLPAAFWSTLNGRRVMVATATINLQDQLINKDIPELQRILPFELRAAVLKGKRNYVCTRLLQQLRHSGPRSADEMIVYARILCWLPYSNSGDLAEITLRSSFERIIWSRLSAENDVCGRETCATEMCPLHVARRRAEMANIVVVNHALLLADVNTRFLPQYRDVIIDEAHHLEAAVTDGLSFRADRRLLETLLGELRGQNGLVATVLGQVQILPADYRLTLEGYLNRLQQTGEDGLTLVGQLFDNLSYFLQDNTDSRANYSQSVRLIPAARKQPQWDEVELLWEPLGGLMKRIVDDLGRVATGISELSEHYDLEDAEDLILTIANTQRQLAELLNNLHTIIAAPSDEMIYWLESYRERVSIHAAPLHVGPLVERHIFDEMESVILASATLRTASTATRGKPTFDYLRQRLHAYAALEAAVGSPFDYADHALLYLATDIPEPNQPGYQRYVEDAIVDVATALGGRTLVLFTSYGQLNTTAREIEGRLAEAGIALLAQSEGASRQQLLSQFRLPGARAVLLGTRSFWEGVDVPGDALQAVLIARIPFDVPSDPIFAARAETFENSFFDYSIPEAVLRFRQGFGRLLRRTTDVGVVAILDKRVLTKRYGQLFVESLPGCTVLRQRTARLGELTVRWINKPREP